MKARAPRPVCEEHTALIGDLCERIAWGFPSDWWQTSPAAAAGLLQLRRWYNTGQVSHTRKARSQRVALLQLLRPRLSDIDIDRLEWFAFGRRLQRYVAGCNIDTGVMDAMGWPAITVHAVLTQCGECKRYFRVPVCSHDATAFDIVRSARDLISASCCRAAMVITSQPELRHQCRASNGIDPRIFIAIANESIALGMQPSPPLFIPAAKDRESA